VRELLLVEGILRPVGLDYAFVGVARRGDEEFAVYDEAKILEKLVEEDGMNPQEAIEYFDFNIAGAWVGPSTAAFVQMSADASAWECGVTNG